VLPLLNKDIILSYLTLSYLLLYFKRKHMILLFLETVPVFLAVTSTTSIVHI